MEKSHKTKQYAYNETSNLVLNLETSRRETGPSGEVTSLTGVHSSAQMASIMGDKISRSRPKELEKRLAKAKAKREKQSNDKDAMKRRRQMAELQSNVLAAEVDAVYRPQTRETRAAYEVLLNFIQQEMGDKPHDVLRSAADEVLAILKDDGMKTKTKQREVEQLFRSKRMDENRFSSLFNIGQKITDYTTEEDADRAKAMADEPTLDEDHGVPVVFDDEEVSDDEIDEIADESDDEEGEEAKRHYNIESKMDGDGMIDDDAEEDELDVRTIDAFWLQRELGKFYDDAHLSQKNSEEVLGLLGGEDFNERDCENKLVLLLDYDKFDFIKLLLRNRLKVVYCTRLSRAKNDAEKKAIQSEMLESAKLRPILEALNKTATAEERNEELERKLREEARKLAAARESQRDGELPDLTQDPFWNKRPKAVLDLEQLQFDAGAHFMSTKDVKLPPKSEVVNKKGYQEVHIPAVKSTPSADERQVKISELPDWAHKGFKGLKTLNRVQSKVYETAFNSPENMLLCAPTGAGKTNCAMLTIMREIGLNTNKDGSINSEAFKIVYVAPMKSLVQEMVMNFGKRLEPYGLQVKELSGDNQLTKAQIAETNLIVTTPEKWDIITRKAGDRTYTQLVKLVIIDEIHLLHDSRGPVLESIVSRTIRQVESSQQLIRLVGLSATLPNYEDVAMFLRVKPDKGLFFFDNAYRPCPLQQQYIGITQKKAFKRFEMMNEICYEKVSEQAGKNQVLVFVHSRKETATTAQYLRDTALDKEELSKFVKEEEGRGELLKAEAENAKHEALRDLLPYGFAIHHAGMNRDDRTLVEELFSDGHIQVLCSTSTLAWGVNLPAHTVIIKGTQVYNPEQGKWGELSPLDVMQMMGRAGRPQYDTFGEGIIITSHKELHYYLSLLNEQLPVESQFISRLADNLNAEIVMGSVSSVKDAVHWLGYSYLYVRMLRRPQLYGVSHEMFEEDPLLEQRRVDLIHTAASLLDKHNLIKYDRKTGSFQATDLGHVASHYYITHQSMAVFNEYLKPTMSDIEMFRVFSLSSEFKYMTVREEEKLELAKLLDKVPIPVKESIEEPSAKVNVLLQAYISRLSLEGFALLSDMVFITQSAGRIMRALFEIVLKRGWASIAVKALNLCKMVGHRMWGAQSPLRQFRDIPGDIIKRIEGKDFPWERFYDLEAHAIGELIRFPKMGRLIHKATHQLPRLDLQGSVQPITRSVLRVELTITPDFQYNQELHGHAEPFWIVVEDVDGETILHHEYFILKSAFATEEHNVNFTIPIHDPLPPQYFIRVVSDRWLGSEVVLPISFRNLVLPQRYPAPTELLDLQPLPVTDVASERFVSFYNGEFEYFNPIQTQVFNTVYKRSDNFMLAAPTGSGKTVVAELAIMRMLQQHPDDVNARCVYIAPLESLAQERYDDWSKRLGGQLGLRVVKLTGETTADLRLLQQGQVVISTPQHWDVMSRRWKTRANVQNVKLFIVDEMHLIGGDSGPVLEVIVSRMRYISSQKEQPIRIVGLSTSVANAKDLGEWIGASSSGTFAFHPNVRPVPLETRIRGFDVNNFNARSLAMVKPAYESISRHSAKKPAIVFVSSRKQCRRVAIDFMALAGSDSDASRFLHVEREALEPHLKHVKNKTLRTSLASGIGFYHAGLTVKERAVVNKLYSAGAIQVVVAEFNECWGMTMTAHMVVIMGTQFYDGREHRYVALPITDIVQMIGRATRPKIDSSGKCTLFCQSSKKQFFKKFLNDPFPVESHLDHYLHDHLNAEIITKRVDTVQDAVDYLTWSFFYRRLTHNPNYYNLAGTSHRHVSDHLSELVENTLDDLQQSKCISIEDEMDLAPLNLGMIASYYYIRYTTVETFSASLKKKTKLKGLLEILCSAAEFEDIPVRHREDVALRKVARHLPLPIAGAEASQYSDPHTKTNVLLQSHFSRIPLVGAVASDQDKLLPDAVRLLQAMVDVISSSGWLSPALACMELSQMVTQGMWNTDNALLQLPHVSKEMAALAEKHEITSVPDLMDMEDEDRNKLLGLSAIKMQDVAIMCNNFPDIELNFEVEDKDELKSGARVSVIVQLERDPDDEEPEEIAGIPKVSAPRYPIAKSEGWWLVLGNDRNELVSIKRVAMKRRKMQLSLDFTAPAAGEHKYTLYFMSDSYMGCDQEYQLDLSVAQGEEMSDDESEESSSDEDSE